MSLFAVFAVDVAVQVNYDKNCSRFQTLEGAECFNSYYNITRVKS